MMYNIDVGDTMREFLFKIKKLFLIILSFFFQLLFDRKSSTNDISNTLEEDRRERRYPKGTKNKEKYEREDESKGKKHTSKKDSNDNFYPSIKKDIEKVYIIQKYVDDISFQLKKENSYQELTEMYDELERYREQILSLQKEIAKFSVQEEENQEFISICDKVNEKIKINEKIIKVNLSEKQETEIVTIEEEEQVEELADQNVINDLGENLEEIERNREVQDKPKQNELKQELEEKREPRNKTEEEKHPLKEQIVIKDIPPVVTKSNEKKETQEVKKQENIPSKNTDIGSYKIKLENIRNMIRHVTISKQRKVIKKVSSNITTAMLVFATLSPVINPTSNNTKKIAAALLINNKLRQSNNMLSNKKKRTLKYKKVISKTQSDDVSVHIDYILNDALSQIRQLRSMLAQYGITSEVLDILNQLDELEAEMLEKMSQINAKGNAYTKKIIR